MPPCSCSVCLRARGALPTDAQSSWSRGLQGHQMSRVSGMTHSHRRRECHQATVPPAGWCVGGGSLPPPGFWLVTPTSHLPAKTASPCLSERWAPAAADSAETRCSSGQVSNLRPERLPVRDGASDVRTPRRAPTSQLQALRHPLCSSCTVTTG